MVSPSSQPQEANKQVSREQSKVTRLWKHREEEETCPGFPRRLQRELARKAVSLLLSAQWSQNEAEPNQSQGSEVNAPTLCGGELPQLIWAGVKRAEALEAEQGGLPASYVLCQGKWVCSEDRIVN